MLSAAVLLAVALCAPAQQGARAVFESAARSLSANNLPAAEQGFLAFLKLRPNHRGALGNLGVVYSRMGRFGDAVKVYRDALRLAPNDPDLNLNLGLAYLKQDDHRSAKEPFRKALAARSDHAQTCELLATAQLFTGEAAEALTTLEPVRESGAPGVLYLLSVAHLRQGERDRAKHAIDQMFRKLSAAQAHLLAGRAYCESTLFQDAAAEFEKARIADPDLPGLWRELGKLYVSLRRADDARNALREAVRRDSADSEAVYFLGALLVQEGSVAEGVPLLDKARSARPDFWGSYYYLGKAALDRRAAADAAALLGRAAELNPDEPAVLYQLARALKLAGQDDKARQVSERMRDLRTRTQSDAEQALVAK